MIWDICNVFAAMGRSKIDLYEWQRQNVNRLRLPRNSLWATYATKVGTLPLTGFRLAHAVVKADFLISRNYLLPGLGFMLQMDQILDFGSTSNLRLHPGARANLADVTQSSTTGRVGQGLSLLFAERQGYDFVGHLASDPVVIALRSQPGLTQVADFLFEDTDGDRMILESKSTFSLSDNECSPVKTMLKTSLEEQVTPWMTVLTPTPAKGYAVYSCLRETGNPTDSAMMFVDPPGEKGDFQIELPGDWVRRRNYAAWLKVMGLRDAAARLENPSQFFKDMPRARSTRLRVARVSGREFAVLTSLDRSATFKNRRFAIGMDLAALQAVEAAIAGSNESLPAYEPLRVTELDSDVPLSILGDGSIFGLIDEADIGSSSEAIL